MLFQVVDADQTTRRQVPEKELSSLLLVNNGGAPGVENSKQIESAKGAALQTPPPAPVPTAQRAAQILTAVSGNDTQLPPSREENLSEESVDVASGVQAVVQEDGSGLMARAAVPAIGNWVGGADIAKINGVEVAVAVAASVSGSFAGNSGGRAGAESGYEIEETLDTAGTTPGAFVATTPAAVGAADDVDHEGDAEAVEAAAAMKRAMELKAEADEDAAKEAALATKIAALQAEFDALHAATKAKAEAAADAMAAAEKKKRLSEQRIKEARNAALAAGSGLAGIDSVLN